MKPEKSYRKELMVGGLVVLSLALMVVFGWLMGVIGGFSREARFHLLYGFAGGVEVGSPVRVSGVKVGKVERIDFLPEPKTMGEGDRVTIRLTISVATRAKNAVRQDSKFYVNMAGIIGERYIEISPGTLASAALADGAEVRGVDPPRIDQLLSQGYGVFGQIRDFIDENQQTLKEFLDNTTQLLTDMNKLMKGRKAERFFQLVDNLYDVTSDLKSVTGKLRDRETKQFFERLNRMVERADQIDHAALKKFLQEEGIRAHLF